MCFSLFLQTIVWFPVWVPSLLVGGIYIQRKAWLLSTLRTSIQFSLFFPSLFSWFCLFPLLLFEILSITQEYSEYESSEMFLNFHRLFILLCWILIHLNPHPIPKKRCFFLRNKPLFVHFSFSIYSIFDLCPRAISFSVFSIFFAGKQPRILCFCVLSIILPPILTLELSVR